MKTIIFSLLILLGTLEAKEYKAVFNCSSGDAGYINSRMWLIGKTIDMIQEKGNKATFAITLHGGCVAMISKDYDMIVPDEDIENIKKAQQQLRSLVKDKGVEVTVCAMSLASNAIEKSEVVEFVKISPNSFIDTIEYQNNGYALMTLK